MKHFILYDSFNFAYKNMRFICIQQMNRILIQNIDNYSSSFLAFLPQAFFAGAFSFGSSLANFF